VSPSILGSVSAVSRVDPFVVQHRNALTIKALGLRVKSVKNIAKITKAMKMVAASKLNREQTRLEKGQGFCVPAVKLYENFPQNQKVDKSLTYLAITGDKGLCGGVNSQVVKKVRMGIVEHEAQGINTKLFIVGGKGVTGLKRLFGDRYEGSVEEVTKTGFNYGQAAIIAERVAAMNPDSLRICYNRFVSLISYECLMKNVVTQSDIASTPVLQLSQAVDKFSFEPSMTEMSQDLHEFYLVSTVYGAMLNNIVSEESSRMAAMENASKNASEMIDKLELLYNKARQAKITTELCEIVSGASAV